MAITLGNVGKAITGVGSALGNFGSADQANGAAAADLLSAEGYDAEAAYYTQAGGITETNRKIQAGSTRVQEAQEFRKVYTTIDSQRSTYAGSGLAISGSALDVMKDTATKGEINRQVIRQQGGQQDLELQQEGLSYAALSQQAKAAAEGARAAAEANKAAAAKSSGGGFLGILGSILSIF